MLISFLLGKIPFEIEVGQQGDKGLPFVLQNPESKSTKTFKKIINKIRDLLENSKEFMENHNNTFALREKFFGLE